MVEWAKPRNPVAPREALPSNVIRRNGSIETRAKDKVAIAPLRIGYPSEPWTACPRARSIPTRSTRGALRVTRRNRADDGPDALI